MSITPRPVISRWSLLLTTLSHGGRTAYAVPMSSPSPTSARSANGGALGGTGLPEDLVVTGEAVALDIRPASFALRLVAGFLDAALYAVLVWVALIGMLLSDLGASTARVQTLFIAGIVVIMVVLPATVETLSRGCSLGKLAAGIRIVRDDGGPIRFRHALVRALVGIGELWMTVGAAAIVTSLVNRRGKRLGDLLAGTYAVRVRTDARKVRPLVMPPELADWAAGADIRALPSGLALQSRRFLDRTGTMSPAHRDHLGRQLAARVEPLVAPPPPWGTHPERFLAAVLVARRDRDYEVGLRNQQRVHAETAHLRRLPHDIAG